MTWLLALITLLAGAALTVARTSSGLAANRLAVVRAELLADSAIRRALLSLLAPDAAGRWPLTGQPVPFTYRDAAATVRLSDESGRVDINGADAELLSAVFAANGVPARDAHALAARMIDWRDVDDDVTGAVGAERQHYGRQALGYGPRNGPFESVDEMWLVLGMPQELRHKVDRVVTAFTGQAGVSASAASAEVRAVLEWAERNHWAGRRWLDAAVAPSETERSPAGRVFRISARGGGAPAQAVLSREAVVRITGNLRQPTLVYSWTTQHAAAAAP